MASNSFGQVFRITTLTIFSFLVIVTNARSDDTKIRVLFIGNSLTTVNDLPRLVADLAKSRQHPMEYDVYAPGGKDLSEHASDPVTLNKIKENAWDFVVLQEQSQRPSFDQEQVEEEVYPYAQKLSKLIREANPQSHVVFYMTMAKKNGDPHNAIKVSPELGTYEGMQNRINQSYVNMAMNNDALVAPVGLVWKRVREQYPSIDLYADETHPNLTGTYLTACVFYSVFFNDTAAGLPYPSTIDMKTTSDIQDTTDESVSLPGWNWEMKDSPGELGIALVQALLQLFSSAAENFAQAHNGQYPMSMQDLTAAESPYLNVCMCDQTIKMYRIRCDISPTGYEFIAHSIWPHKESYIVTTGGKLEVKKPGELGRGFPASKSSCVQASMAMTDQKLVDVSTENELNMIEQETTSPPAGQPEDPIFRIGSETVYRKDIHPSNFDISPASLDNWHWSAFHLLTQKLDEIFCKQANCAPNQKDVEEWQVFMDDYLSGVNERMRQRGESSLPETIDEEAMKRFETILGGPPSLWQTHKALFEKYGGRVVSGNLGYYAPVEARLRLFHEMEDKGELEFYDQQIRNGVIEHFSRTMYGAVEVDENFQKERGARHPWEYPFWGKEAMEAMRQKIKAEHEEWQKNKKE